MADKYGIGSWLDGPGAARPGAGEDGDRGQRLGLPEAGQGSIAGWGVRLIAYLIDSAASAAIAWGLLGGQEWTFVVFAAEVWLLTAYAGGSFGQRIAGLRVLRLDRKPVGPLRAAVRTALLVLLIPVFIWDRDGRGLHDRAAGTVLLRVRAARAG